MFVASAATAVLITTVLAVLITVARPDSGRATRAPLVVSGGIPPDPPAAGATPEPGGSDTSPVSGNGWGAAGRYLGWAGRLSTQVPVEARSLAAYALAEQIGL